MARLKERAGRFQKFTSVSTVLWFKSVSIRFTDTQGNRKSTNWTSRVRSDWLIIYAQDYWPELLADIMLVSAAG